MNKWSYRTKWSLLVAVCILTAVGSLCFGQTFYSPGTVYSAIVAGGTDFRSGDYTKLAETYAVIWHIRLPRIIAGLLVGAALAVSGAVMQGIFSNPLAEPGILGLSSGAALGAVIAIALGLTGASLYVMPLFAVVGSVFALGIILLLAVRQGKIPVMVLLLAGVAVNSFTGALTNAVLMILNEQRLREYLFWIVGGLDYRRWEHITLAIGPIMAAVIILFFMSRHLNILALGETEARSVGLHVIRYRLIFLGLAATATAAAVCISGSIGFVGLMIPHMMRFLVGPDHRQLLPVSALAGGTFLVACDTLGRSLFGVIEIRVGIITALLGAPYFLYLLRRAQRKE